MLRGINKQPIFESAEDYSQFIEYLSEVKKISGFKLYAYCLMGNHLHLLVKETDEPLSQIIKRLGARYVYWFNRKYGRSGHLFQDRFKSEPVETDDHLATIVVYIYQNPVKAGICGHPSDYEWSSRKQLGSCEAVDEEELFSYVPADVIKKLETTEVDCEALEPKAIYSKAITDADAVKLIKAISGAESMAGFQSLGRQKQALVFAELRGQGVSVRQFARLTGLGKGVVERLSRNA
jgi:REP element-mobilizing transposase RayT